MNMKNDNILILEHELLGAFRYITIYLLDD